MRIDVDEAWALLRGARVARFATLRPDGSPHVVPVVFCVDGGAVYWAVDDKPKRSVDLARLRNIASDPRAELLVDHYDEDWAALWWVRASGTARVVEDDAEAQRAREALRAKYLAAREYAPSGPVVALDVAWIRGWRSSPG